MMNRFTDVVRGMAGLSNDAATARGIPFYGQNTPLRNSYKTGGLVGVGGVPVKAAAQQTQPMNPQMMQMQVQQIASQNPQAIEQIKTAIQQAMQTGELTMEELSTAVHMAKVALANPALYPQLRQFAIKQGIATEQDLPQDYDQGLLFVLLVAGQAMQNELGAPGSPTGQGQPTPQQGAMPAAAPAMRGVPSMQDGGALPQRSTNLDGSIPINAHEGEFVIPKHVVLAKGTDFFNKMIEQYDPNSQ